MSDDYQQFRRRTLDELKTEQPELNYQQKLRIVSEKWSQLKITQLTTVTVEEIVHYMKTPEKVPNFYRRLKYTIETLTESEFMKLTIEESGDNLLLTFLDHRLRTDDAREAKITHAIFRKFIGFEAFYKLRVSERVPLDILDLVVYHQRKDIIYNLLSNAPEKWLYTNLYTQEARSKASCVFGLLFLNIDDKEMRPWIMEFLRQSMKSGLDPNLEIGDVICGVTKSFNYNDIDDEVYGYFWMKNIPHSIYKHFVNYSGMCDVGSKYREYLNQYKKLGKEEDVNNDLDNTRFVGQTIFSVYLYYAENQRHRSFCESLLNMDLINLKTIVVVDEVPTSYQAMLFEGPAANPRLTVNAGFVALHRTPAYFLYVKSAREPVKRFIESMKTPWEVLVYSKTNIWDGLKGLFYRYLVLPDKELLNRLVVSEELSREIEGLYSSPNSGLTIGSKILADHPRPLNTCLAKLLLTEVSLEKIVNELRAGNTKDWSDGFTREVMQMLIDRKFNDLSSESVDDSEPRESPTNEWFMLSGESTEEGIKKPPVTIFRSEDNFMFQLDEFDYLLEKGENPFNRRVWSFNETNELETKTEIFKDWWFLYPSGYLTTTVSKKIDLEERLVALIDGMIDQSPFFVYGERLRNHVGKLRNTPALIHGTYMFLFSGPEIMTTMGIDEGLTSSSISFQAKPHDHLMIEEINVFFGLKFAYYMNEQNNTEQGGLLKILLLYIYLILTATEFYESNARLQGRIINLYIVIAGFIKNSIVEVANSEEINLLADEN